MTLAIMQPYFLPYIGYWQLLSMADRFVLYDNIQYTKKGWINRNRFWRAGGDAYFTIPVKAASDYLTVAEREVAPDFDRARLLAQVSASYRKAPYFARVFPVFERIVMADRPCLFDFVHHSLVVTADFLGIRTPIVVSSTVAIDHTLRSEAKVLALCQALGADRYVNPIGGRELYSPAAFRERGVSLRFLQTRSIRYPQFGGEFVPNLSILDALMFNSPEAIHSILGAYDVV